MNARTKLGWVEVPQRSLHEGLACGQGGARILLMMGSDSPPVVPTSTPLPPRSAQSQARPEDEPR